MIGGTGALQRRGSGREQSAAGRGKTNFCTASGGAASAPRKPTVASSLAEKQRCRFQPGFRSAVWCYLLCSKNAVKCARVCELFVTLDGETEVKMSAGLPKCSVVLTRVQCSSSACEFSRHAWRSCRSADVSRASTCDLSAVLVQVFKIF